MAARGVEEIFHRYTDLVEPLSLDEGFLDVTENFKRMPSAAITAKGIKKKNYFVQDFGDGKNGLLLLTFKSIDKHIKEI